MSFKDVTELRKSGNLEEAFQLATSDLQNEPDNIWSKRAIGWVYYDFANKAIEQSSPNDFIEQVDNVKRLELPQEEIMLPEKFLWLIGNLLRKNKVTSTYLDRLFNLIRNLSFPRSAVPYTLLIKEVAKQSHEWDEFLNFVNWWGLDNFQKEDYGKFVLEDGKKITSTVESVYIAISKKLLKEPVDLQAVNEFIPKIAHISMQYPEMQYPLYYYAKFLLLLGDREHFKQAFIPFAKKKQKDFWVWDLMSQVYDKRSKEYFSCLCKSLACGAPDKFTGNVREKIADVFIEKRLYSEAKFEMINIIEARNREGWRLNDKHHNWQNYPWWATASLSPSNLDVYIKNVLIAEGLLYSDVEEELIVVNRVNKEKSVLNFVVSTQKYGLIHYGNYNVIPNVGEVYSVRFVSSDNLKKSSFYKIHSIVLCDKPAPKELYKQVEGRIIINQGNSFGFIEQAFVSSQIINNYQLKNGSILKANVIQSYNPKHKTLGWNVVSIIK